jgi:hypothetical protein
MTATRTYPPTAGTAVADAMHPGVLTGGRDMVDAGSGTPLGVVSTLDSARALARPGR